MTERPLDEVLAAIFGRDGGDFAAGACRCARNVETHFDAVRAEEKRLKALSEELENECKRLRQLAQVGLTGRPNEKGQGKAERDRKRVKG